METSHSKLAWNGSRKGFEYWPDYTTTILVLIFPYIYSAITCLKLTIETLEQGVKYVQS